MMFNLNHLHSNGTGDFRFGDFVRRNRTTSRVQEQNQTVLSATYY